MDNVRTLLWHKTRDTHHENSSVVLELATTTVSVFTFYFWLLLGGPFTGGIFRFHQKQIKADQSPASKSAPACLFLQVTWHFESYEYRFSQEPEHKINLNLAGKNCRQGT
jgi:hypothetical protein